MSHYCKVSGVYPCDKEYDPSIPAVIIQKVAWSAEELRIVVQKPLGVDVLMTGYAVHHPPSRPTISARIHRFSNRSSFVLMPCDVGQDVFDGLETVALVNIKGKFCSDVTIVVPEDFGRPVTVPSRPDLAGFG